MPRWTRGPGAVVEGYLRRPPRALRDNSAAKRLKRLAHETDLEFCPSDDAVSAVPRLAGGAFVGAREGAGSLAPVPNKKAKFILDTEVERLYSAVSQGGSNVTR